MKQLNNLISDFLWEHCTYLHEKNTKEQLLEAVKKHHEYRTIVCTWDNIGLTGVCRFNINDAEAKILDVAVRSDCRNQNLLQTLLEKGLKMYPQVEQLRFNSIDKNREFTISINTILTKEK